MSNPLEQPECVRLAVFGAGHVFSLCAGRSGKRALYTACLYDLMQGTAFSAIREAKIAPFQRKTPHGTALQACGADYEITIQPTADTLEVYGHIYRFKEKTPLLFDIVLKAPEPVRQPNHAASLHNHRADGRVMFGEQEYYFSPAVSIGLLAEQPYANRWVILSSGEVTNNDSLHFMPEVKGSALLKRFLRSARLDCSAGHASGRVFCIEEILLK